MLKISFFICLTSIFGIQNILAQVINIKKDISFESVMLNYSLAKGELPFKSIKIGLSPFSRFLEFETEASRKIIYDCFADKTLTHFNCLSGCEGGKIKISFNKNIKFDVLRVDPFQILDRACDGSESADDKKLISKTPAFLKIKAAELN